MLGGSVVVYDSLLVQTRFGMSRGAKMSWLSVNQTRLLFIQIPTLPPSMDHKWKAIIDIA